MPAEWQLEKRDGVYLLMENGWPLAGLDPGGIIISPQFVTEEQSKLIEDNMLRWCVEQFTVHTA